MDTAISSIIVALIITLGAIINALIVRGVKSTIKEVGATADTIAMDNAENLRPKNDHTLAQTVEIIDGKIDNLDRKFDRKFDVLSEAVLEHAQDEGRHKE